MCPTGGRRLERNALPVWAASSAAGCMTGELAIAYGFHVIRTPISGDKRYGQPRTPWLRGATDGRSLPSAGGTEPAKRANRPFIATATTAAHEARRRPRRRRSSLWLSGKPLADGRARGSSAGAGVSLFPPVLNLPERSHVILLCRAILSAR